MSVSELKQKKTLAMRILQNTNYKLPICTIYNVHSKQNRLHFNINDYMNTHLSKYFGVTFKSSTTISNLSIGHS